MLKIFSKHPHWTTVSFVYRKLLQGNFQVLLAGGCVRDALLGLSPKDFDIATNAKPDEIHALFPESLMIGKAFGVVMIPFEGGQLEVATFRRDGPYKDGRHPEGVSFSSAEEDAQRRDFTVNALFADLKTEKVLDYVGGQEDLHRKILKAVGDPQKRFEEDHLRVLRAVRFSAQLGFEIESATWEALRVWAPKVEGVSFERVRDEWVKLLVSSRPQRGVAQLWDLGLLDFLAPKSSELLQVFEGGLDLFSKTKLRLELASRLSNEPKFRLGAFYFDRWQKDLLNAADFQNQMRRLKFSNEVIDETQAALSATLSLSRQSTASLRRTLAKPWATLFWDLVNLESQLSPREEFDRVRALGVAPLPAAFVTSEMLAGVGVQPGPRMGQILKEGLDAQLEGEILDSTEAMRWVLKKL